MSSRKDPPSPSDAQFRALLDLFQLSFEGYRRVRKGVKKRLHRHLQALGLRRFEDYLDALSRDPALERECRVLLTVSISRFFRDAELWRFIGESILPRMAHRASISAWSAGAAAGEEAFSLKLVHEQWREQTGSAQTLSIAATDLNPANLERAAAGVYPRGSLREVPPELVERCFEKLPGHKKYRLLERYREGVELRPADLLADPPPGAFDLVFVRNGPLTYLAGGLRVEAARRAAAGLAPGGYLIIGAKEDWPGEQGGLRPCPELPYVFRKEESIVVE